MRIFIRFFRIKKECKENSENIDLDYNIRVQLLKIRENRKFYFFHEH